VENRKTYRALGLMSGSSLDGLDVAFCEFQMENSHLVAWQILQAETVPYDVTWQEKLQQLPRASGQELALGHAHFGHYLGELTLGFIQKHQIEPDFIASHGHTIFHFPNEKMTLQIGDGAAMAAATGYPVVSDFRAMDVALGGQGAPLAPIADRLLFPGYDFYLNLGGIANITCDVNGKFIAFDIGGANQLLNFLARQLNKPFDEGGALAASGTLHAGLLAKANALPYFEQTYPKSLGNDWVQEQLIPIFRHYKATVADKLHTACLHIAWQIAKQVTAIIEQEALQKEAYQLFVTGGGAHNDFLLQCLEQACAKAPNIEIVIPDPLIISFKEAALMALMGVLRQENRPNCMATVTGASRDAIGGALHQGWRREI